MGDGASRELREGGSCSEWRVVTVSVCPRPGPEAGGDTGAGGGGPCRDDSGRGGGVGGLEESCSLRAPPGACALLAGRGGRLTEARADSVWLDLTSLCIIFLSLDEDWVTCPRQRRTKILCGGPSPVCF